jgi:hypothetical protein
MRFLCLIFLTLIGVHCPAQKKQSSTPIESIPVDQVWSGHPVGFDILTTDRYQYLAYYDADRIMVIAQRPLDSREWKKTKLPSILGWDSHNYIELGQDKEGYLHVSGNMHVVPLVYFRSEKPENIDHFESLSMTGNNENRVTYPVFFKDKDGELYFQYRNGGSGNGITYWNRYDTQSKTWTGLFDTPVFDGEDEANAYMTQPKLGTDGYFYIVWMWRLTPTANTNHNLSCIRSLDLIHWEAMSGEPMTLPIRWRNTKAVVDPVAPWNGLINMSFQISWDTDKTPYITYHKFDNRGISQVFTSRWEKTASQPGAWQTYQLSQWKEFTWDLNRSGSLSSSVSVSAITPDGKGNLTARFGHEKYGAGSWVLDRKSLKIKQTIPATAQDDAPDLPPLVLQPDMQLRTKMDNTGHYLLRWQALPANQDKARTDSEPTPVELVLYKVDK